MGNLKTKPSLPVEVVVDGGWAILQAPQHPVLVGETMTLQCHLRGNFPVHETILYRNGVEVMRQNGYNSHFRLTEATVEDDGLYSCRASWDMRQQTHSVISVDTPVHVVEVLSEPVLEIDADAKMGPDKMKLICHVKYHARAPAPPINFYFYKNNKLMGPAVSANHNVFRRAPGWYSCRAKVPQLDLVQWSEARSFGDVPGTQMPPPRPHVRSFKPLASSKSPPGHRLTPAAQLTRSQRLAATPSVSERSLHRAFGAPSRFELPKPSSPSTDQFSNQSPPPRPFIVSQDDD
uniref:Ig-like domain-containing protein n=2 Tax=Kryptolebias marmoratus TaxID=37003 RepID=A0A3Q3BNX1_KRYMA